jgi:predicted alpha/beta superfamily hydrolase
MPATTPLTVEQFELPHPDGSNRFRIDVARPAGLAEGARVPILFVTDSDIFFGVAAEIARLKAVGGAHPNALVVGIGYGAEFLEMAKLRTADLTPPLSEAGRAAIGNFTSFIGEQNGGAEALLGFLTDVLLPEVGRRFSEADTSRTILFGHSLGGLFASYALLTRPGAFTAFVASSPSLWWDGFAVFSHLEGFSERLAALAVPPVVLLDVGAKEQDLPQEVPAPLQLTLEEVQAMVVNARMVDGLADFVEKLRAAGLTGLAHTPFKDEDHSTVVPAAIMRGLTVAFDAWNGSAAGKEPKSGAAP